MNRAFKALVVGIAVSSANVGHAQTELWRANIHDPGNLTLVTANATIPTACSVLKARSTINAVLDKVSLTDKTANVTALVSQDAISECGTVLVPAGSIAFGTATLLSENSAGTTQIAWHMIFPPNGNDVVILENKTIGMKSPLVSRLPDDLNNGSTSKPTTGPNASGSAWPELDKAIGTNISLIAQSEDITFPN